jgi:NADPH:quinone reductase-like Zn-dependent oxidoreductase
MNDPQPRAGELRIRVAFSGVNPGDVKKREDAFGVGMPYPRVIPHSDGSGIVDAVGEGVSREWVGRRAEVLALKVTVLSAPLPSTPVVLAKQGFHCRTLCRWGRVHVSAFPA